MDECAYTMQVALTTDGNDRIEMLQTLAHVLEQEFQCQLAA